MKRLAVLGIAGLLGAALLISPPSIGAQESESASVKAVIDNLHAALTALDAKKMGALWAHDADVTLINPRDKTISVGWDAVKQNWDATFTPWAELKVTQLDNPHIHVDGRFAWSSGIALAAGKLKNGTPVSAPTFEIDVLQKRGNNWMIVSHTGLRVSQ
jgi:ketosteroid isomerase-like protein